jgi:glycosyltransferase involved in cell wall biosynthesis
VSAGGAASARGPGGAGGDGSPLHVAFITAGAAGMYCGTCLQDNTLASRLIRMGHDVSLIPTYTPIRTDENDVSVDHVFYGAINVYLEQKSAVFRHTPWLMDKLLNGRSLLRWASSHGASVDARDLGDLTLSVLKGRDGKQRKELDKLVAWLRDELKPQVVHVSNSMFLGIAEGVREELGIPVVTSLQGEDIFLEDLDEPWRTRVHETLREKARKSDAFVAASHYYAEFMSDYLDVPSEKIHIVPLGINLEGFGPAPERPAGGPFVVGYLARVCPEKGLHLLVEAFRRLTDQVGRDNVLLRIAGYLGPRDQEYFDHVTAQIREWGLADRVDHVGEVDRRQKIEFLQSLDVLSVPTVYREPKGLFVLEALACGVPVVLPRHGAFPELIERTGGGVLVAPESPDALAEGIRGLLRDPSRGAELGRRGQEVVDREYNDAWAAARLLDVYRPLVR